MPAWRRGRDSNPRYLAAHLISSQAHSTTLPPLLKNHHYADEIVSSNPLLLQTRTVAISTLARIAIAVLDICMSKPILKVILSALALLLGSCQSNKIVSIDFSDGTFKGEVDEEGAKNGKGAYLWYDGSSYKGDFLKDERHGLGSFTWANGEKYVGEYLEGERTGEGSYFWPDGSSYEGSFLKGSRHGEGVFTSSDGTTYQGEWLNDQQHGKGVLVFADGRRIQGLWKNGKIMTSPAMLPPKAEKPILIVEEIPQETFDPITSKSEPESEALQGKPTEGTISPLMPNDAKQAPPPIPPTSKALTDAPAFDLNSKPADKEISNPIEADSQSTAGKSANKSPVGISEPSESTVWTGTVEEAEIEFTTELINGLDTVRVKKSNEPFTGTMRILNRSGSLQGSVNLENGLLHGEEVFYESDGSVSEKNVWENGRLVK